MEINSLIKQVINLCYDVHKELGHGFNEKVFERSLSIALRDAGIEHTSQHPMTVYFRGEVVGEFYADILVNGSLAIELKAVSAIDSSHKSQVLNYLKASRLKTGILVNFGAPKLEVNRLYNNALIAKEG